MTASGEGAVWRHQAGDHRGSPSPVLPGGRRDVGFRDDGHGTGTTTVGAFVLSREVGSRERFSSQERVCLQGTSLESISECCEIQRDKTMTPTERELLLLLANVARKEIENHLMDRGLAVGEGRGGACIQRIIELSTKVKTEAERN